MTNLEFFIASGLAVIIFLMLVLLTIMFETMPKSKKRELLNSYTERSLKPDQVFNNSKVQDIMDLRDDIKGS